MWTGGEEVAEKLGWSTDVDRNGVVDDGVAYGFDTYALTAEDQAAAGDVDGFGPMDKNGHGTHVAGIVGAQLNNNEGGSGVAPGVKIMALRAAVMSSRLLVFSRRFSTYKQQRNWALMW